MDTMQLLRDFRNDQPEPDGDHLAGIWHGIQQRLPAAASTRTRRPVRSSRRRGLVVGLIGCAAVTALVIGITVAAPAAPASAEVGLLLQRASSTAEALPSGGRYRTLTVREDALGLDGDQSPIAAAYIQRSVQVLRVPTGSGGWTRSSYRLPTKTFFGGAAGRAFARRDQGGTVSGTRQHPVVEHSSDGTFTVGELGGPDDDVFGSVPIALRDLPHDPGALLKAFRAADLGPGERVSQPEHVVQAATVVLQSGVADAALQSAVFQALLRQPGLAVTDRTATLDGIRGVAIGLPARDEKHEALQLVLDDKTGRYLGSRQITLTAIGVVPAGTVEYSTAVTER